jgi:type VI secretion system secreted protein VgrG
MFVPRIGMEVVVNFIDGDPDRPLVTGCVYNGLNRPAHEQPAQKTKSYIKTQSSPSGKGFNELQFEDADGSEEVYLHAQRDHKEVVKNDQTIAVGASRTKTVSGAETATIKKTRSHTVHGVETLRVVDGSDRHVEVTGNEIKQIRKKRELEVTEGTKDSYQGGRETTVKSYDTLNVVDGANKQDHVTGQYNITADEHFKVKQGGDELYMKDAFYVSSQGDVQLKNAGFQLHATKDGKTTIKVGQELTITVGRASITLKADGTVEISGPTTAKVSAQGGSFEATMAGATVTGQTATVSGMTMTEIKGPIVKVN